MKKYTFILAFLALLVGFTNRAAAQCDGSESCYITLELNGSYYYSWEGSSVAVIQGGQTIGTYTLNNVTYGTFEVPVCATSDDVVVKIQSLGYYTYATSVAVYNGDDTEELSQAWLDEYEYGDTLVSFTVTCPACPKPKNLAVSAITNSGATISWEEPTAASSFEYTYGTSSVCDNNWQTVSTNSVSLSGLDANTTYYFFVRAVCSSENSNPVSISFKTLCGTLTAEQLPLVETFPTNGMPDCWTVVESSVNYGTTYPYVSYLYVNGSYEYYTLYFYSANGSNAVALPPTNVPLDQLELIFDAYNSADFEIGYMTDLTDMETYVPVKYGSGPGTSNGLVNYIITFDDVDDLPTGEYSIVIRVPYVIGATNLYLDNVMLREHIDCSVPYNVHVDATAAPAPGTIHIAWEDSIGTNWQVVYGPNGFDPDTASADQILNAIDPQISISGLDANTAYDVYVRTVCGSTLGYLTTSPCTAVPFSVNMDIFNQHVSVTGCDGMWIFDEGGAFGNAGYSNNFDTATYTIYPEDEFSTVVISGDGYVYNTGTGIYGAKILIYEGEDTTGRLMGSYTGSFSFADLKSEMGAITIVYKKSYYSGTYWGFELNTECAPLPSCRRPYDFAIDYIEGTDVNFSWKYSGDDPDGFTIVMEDLDVEGTVYEFPYEGDVRQAILGGLNERHNYQATLYSTCSGASSDSSILKFATKCIVPQDIEVGAAEGTSNYVLYTYYNHSISQFIYLYSELETETIGGFNLLQATSGSNAYGRQVDVYIDTTSATTIADGYIVQDSANMVFSGEIDLDKQGEYINFSFSSLFNNPEHKNVVITIHDHTGSYVSSPSYVVSSCETGGTRYYYSDGINPAPTEDNAGLSNWYTTANRADIYIEGPCGDAGCLPPTITKAEATSENTIELEWIEGTGTQWKVEHRQKGTDTWVLDAASVVEPSYTITGLLPKVTYTVRISTLCDDGGEGPRTRDVEMPCGAETLPIVVDFETFLGPSSTPTFEKCWFRKSTYSSTYTYYPYVQSYSAYEGNNCLYMYVYYMPAIVTPEIANLQNNAIEVSGYASCPYSDYNPILEVGVCSDPNDFDTYEPFDTIFVEYDNGNYMHFVSYIEDYTGDATHIFLRGNRLDPNEYGYIYLDSIVIAEAPACRDLSSVIVENLTTNSIELTIVDKYARNNYTVYYGTGSMASASQMNATSTNVTISGLTGSTTYNVWVVANCDGDEHSRVYNVGSVSTLCDPIAVTEENIYFTECEGAEDVECMWTHQISGRTDWVVGQTASYNYQYYAYSGFGMLNFASNKANDESMLILPTFDFSGMDTTAEISFYRYQNQYSATTPASQVSVYYRKGISGEWTLVSTLANTENQWEKHFIVLPGSQGASIYQVAIGCKANGNRYGANIDDIRVAPATRCFPPAGFTVTNVTERTATAKWTSSNFPTQRVQFRKSGDWNWSSRISQANSLEQIISPLDIATDYEVRAASVCGNALYSEYTPIISITTDFCADNTTALSYAAGDKDTTAYSTLFRAYYSDLDGNYNYDYYSISEMIIPASQLSGLSNVNAITYVADSAQGGDLEDGFEIYIGKTTNTEFDGTYLYDDSFELVYTGGMSFTDAGDVNVYLNTPYEYDGTSNLVVAIKHNYYYPYPVNEGVYFGAHVASADRFMYSQVGSPFNMNQLNNIATSQRHKTNVLPDIKLIGCNPVCYEPVIARVATSANTLTLEWYNEGANVEVSIKEHSATTWDSPVAVSGNNKYTFTQLPAMTQFDLRVRRACPGVGDGYSDWATTTALTDTACSIPENVHATEVGATTATLTWNNVAVANKWEVHVWNSGFDKYYTVNTNPCTVTGLVPGNSYNVQVRAFCGSSDHVVGEWCETGTFQNTCEPVTGLHATANGTDVTLTWVAGNNSTAYYVAWGPKDFDLNNQMGLEKVTGTSYTIHGLKNNNTFSFRVRAVCADDWNSEWSSQVNATVGTEGIDDVEGQNAQFSLQPNPATDRVTLSLNEFDGVANVSVLSVDGREVSSFTTAETSYSMDLSEYAAGTYFVRVQTENWISVRKLIVK